MSKRWNSETDYAMQAAIDRVYAKYGTDLAAFFRDVEASIEAERNRRDLELRRKYGVGMSAGPKVTA